MEPTSSRGLPVWLLLLGTLGAIIGFGWCEQDYVAAAALAAIAIAGLWGYYVGALHLVRFFGGLAAAYACKSLVGQWLSPHIAQGFDTSPGATRLISLVAGSGATFLLVTSGLAVVSRRLLRDRPRLRVANRWIGLGVGGLQGVAAMLLLLNGIQIVEPLAQQCINVATEDDRDVLAQAVAERVVDIAEHTRRSMLGSLVVGFNPFEELPQLKRLQFVATVASHPEKLQQVMRSPTANRSHDNSEMIHAIELLAQDPQLRRIAESGQPLDPETALSLLNHPGIAKLLEQPDLMQQLSDAMSELDPPLASSATKPTR